MFKRIRPQCPVRTHSLKMAEAPTREEVVEFELSEDVQSQGTETEKGDKLLKFPLARIRTIIKQDPDVHLVNHDSIVLITKATVSTPTVWSNNF